MPGLLDGQIATAIYKGFKGKLLRGSLRRVTPVAVDDAGDPLPSTPTTWGTEGFTDEYGEMYRAQASIPDTDLKVCIFAKSLPAGVKPIKDDMASFTQAGITTWYQLRKVKTDPATALWVCQAFEVPAPLGSA